MASLNNQSRITKEIYKSPVRLVLIFVVAMLFVELFLMVILEFIPPFPGIIKALIDCTILLILLTPILYFFIFRPMINYIIDRNRTEEDLRNAKDFQKNLLQTANVIVIGLNTAGEINMVNEEAEKITGYTFEELEGKNWFDLLIPIENYPQVREEFIALTQSGRASSTFENPILTKSGTERFISWQNGIVPADVGKMGTISFGIDITERKKAEEALKESEEKYRTLLEFAPDAFFQGDFNGNFILVNEKAIELTGYSHEELLSMNMSDLFSADIIKDKPLRYDLLKTGNTIIKERDIIKKTGERIPVEMNSKVMPDGTFQCFMRDFTERKRTEVKLRESEELHRLLADNVNDVIWTMSLEGRFTYVSPSVEKLRGYTVEEVMQQSLNEALTPESVAIAQSHLTMSFKTLSEGKPLPESRLEFEQPCKDGSTVWTEATTSGIFDTTGKFIGILGVTRDITGRKRAEELLKASEERFRQLIANSFDMIVLLDSNGIQHFVSESCEKILGYRPDELMNIDVIEKMIHPDDQEKLISEFKDAVNIGQGGTQYRHRHKNGGWVHLEAFGTNQLKNPAIQSFVLNVRDITERKKVEKALEESKTRLHELNATKDKFFSIIAHDLKSPFHSILGYCNILIKEIQKKDYEGIEKYTGIIQLASSRAMSLLMNLLEWARSQSGSIEFHPEYFETVSLINEVTKSLNDSFQQKSISISIKTPATTKAFADRNMIGTILRNLISNSIKFTNPGGTIIISANQNSDELIIIVSDNGVGISEIAIDKLFRIDESYKKIGTHNEIGTGLGLILCKEFVDKHKGKIWVESKEGEGSTFSFSIPNQNTDKLKM